MTERVIEVGDGFWNIRGDHRIAGLINVGTQSSLVRLGSGGYVMLDCGPLDDATIAWIEDLTSGGRRLDAIVNLHPFHSLHIEAVHERFSGARLHGTARHRERLPELPWANPDSESPALLERFGDDLDFSVPRGVDFVSDNEHVHFSSVLAYHRATGTIHSDDTFNYLGASALTRLAGVADKVAFHPTLGKALEKREGAVEEFRRWASGLIQGWGDARNLCAAHNAVLLAADAAAPPLPVRLQQALDRVDGVLKAHERRHG